MIKVGTICSGIGAPEKALKNLGIAFETMYFCEFDKYAAKSYCAIHGETDTKNLGDLTKVEIEKLAKDLDLLVGGTPCQDFSLAGKRAGGDAGLGTRSSLMWNFVEIISVTKPKVVLWENVPGCLTQGAMQANFRKFYSRLIELGYTIKAEILNAKNFGIPQNRDRVFVVAMRKDLKFNFEIPDGYDCGVRLKDFLEVNVDEKYYLSEKMIAGLRASSDRHKEKGTGFTWSPKDGSEFANCLRANASISKTDNTLIELTSNQPQANRVYDINGIARNLVAEAGGGGAKTGLYQIPHGYNKGGYSEIENCPTITSGTFRFNNLIACAIRGRENGQQLEIGTETANSITTVQKDSLICEPVFDIYNKSVRTDGLAGTAHNGSGIFGVLVNAIQKNAKQEFCDELIEKELVEENDVITHSYTSHKRDSNSYVRGENNMSPTLDTRCDCLGVVQKMRIRKLTPSECLKLMGFSDADYAACKAVEMSDSQLYKQAGNSIVVNVLMAIFGQLYNIDWKEKVYGKWWKSPNERYNDLPLFTQQMTNQKKGNKK